MADLTWMEFLFPKHELSLGVELMSKKENNNNNNNSNFLNKVAPNKRVLRNGLSAPNQVLKTVTPASATDSFHPGVTLTLPLRPHSIFYCTILQ